MIPYTPSNWYWRVAGSNTQVYSSASGDYVPVNNAAYQAWLASSGIPTAVGTEAELGEVLAPLNLRPTAAGVLDGYKVWQAGNIVDAIQFKLLFNHENRLRAIERALSLNGSPADLTANQARNAVKALM